MGRYGEPNEEEERRRREGCGGCLADIGCVGLVTWLLPSILLVLIT